MINNQEELSELLDGFTDSIGALFGRRRLARPYRLNIAGVDYVGAGDSYMHVLIPVSFLPFTVKEYDSFQPMANLLDSIENTPAADVSTTVLRIKMEGLTIASKINGVGFHRKLIAKLYNASSALDISAWKHTNCQPDKLNVFSNGEFKVVIMPFVTTDESTMHDHVNIADIPPFDTNTIESLTPEQASALANSKKTLHLPRLKSLSKEAAMHLKDHIAFDKSKESYSNRVLDDTELNYGSVIRFGPDLKIEDETLQCFNDCYSDLLFDDVKTHSKYEQSKLLVLQKRILRRLGEVLCSENKLEVTFIASLVVTDVLQTWDIILTDERSSKIISRFPLSAIDETGFLEDLFSRLERLDRIKNQQFIFPCLSVWTIDTETKEFLNSRDENIIALWKCENLKTTHFLNGDPIHYAESDEEWINAAEHNVPAYCYVENQAANIDRGLLYNHHVIKDPRGIAPEGWRVANFADWKKLIDNYGGANKAAQVLCSDNNWMNGRNGTNRVGFNLIPTGRRLSDGNYDNVVAHPDDGEGDMDEMCYSSYWLGQNEDPEFALQIYLSSDPDDSIKCFKLNKGYGCCIRLVKD